MLCDDFFESIILWISEEEIEKSCVHEKYYH